MVGHKGFHNALAEVLAGKAPRWRVFRVRVNDPVGDAQEKARTVEPVPTNATWQNVDITSQLKADVTAIYRQKYLSPLLSRICHPGASDREFAIPVFKILSFNSTNKLPERKDAFTIFSVE